MTWHLDDGMLHLWEVTLHLEDETLHPLEGMFHFGAPSHAISHILRETNFKNNYLSKEFPIFFQINAIRCRKARGFSKCGHKKNLVKN
jgi:hypothetical protein